MSAFANCLSGSGTPSQQQDFARTHLPLAVANSELHLWLPDMGMASEGTRVLVGIATWSPYDLTLLDQLQVKLAAGEHQTFIDVFDVDTLCHGPDNFENCIPGIGRVFQTPAVGVWRNGIKAKSAWGAAGKKLLAEMGLVE